MVDTNVHEPEAVEDVQEDTQEGKFLTFALGNEEYGIEIRNVTEIIGIQKITDLPDTPHFVKGVINLRGKVIPVIDVRLRFGLEELEYNDRTCIIVVNIRNMTVGLIVDTVSEVMDISERDVEAPPKVNTTAGARYIQGLGKVGDDVKILLDTHKLLFGEELDQLAESLP
ncbi:MAG: chemotaxis protein CheW [bacterium]